MINPITMKNKFKLIVIFLMSIGNLLSQPVAAPACPTQSIYAHNGTIINGHTLPNGPSTTVLNNLPAGAGGLAIGPAFGFPAPNPTWWTTNGGTYWYYNNAGTWSNTGHSTGNAAAVNLGGGGTCLYNLVGATGQIYKYVGTGNGFLLTTLVPAFGGAGPYDVVCDMADNFYILRGSTPQGIFCYNPSGVLTCSWSVTGMIQQTAGGGFAILNTANPSVHKMYYNSNGTDYIGNMIPGSSIIASTVQALPNGGDYASCALNIPQGLITAPLGGTLTCNLTQIPLVAQVLGNGSLSWLGGYNTPTTTPVTPTCGIISWTGPGIIAGQNTPTITVNQPGVYSYTVNGCNSCPGYSITATYTVVGQNGILTPSITAPTCFTGQTTMSVSPNTNTNTVLWSGPGIVGPNNTFTITFNQPGTYTAVVSSGTACSGTATVLVNPTPTISITSSTNNICQQNFNGSPTTVTFTGSGATTYTWSSTGLSTIQSNTTNPISYTSNIGSSVGSVTLVGSNGTCSNSATYSINIIPNPTIAVTSGSICMGNSITLTANNASTYTWTPNTNLNTNIGPVVISNPTVTTVYSIIGTSLGCNSQTQTSTVTVVPNPIININPAQPVICLGGSINLTANGATNYTWTPNSFLSNTNTPNVVANPTVNTTYTVLGSQNTCTNTAVVTVTVLSLPNITVTPSSPTLCMNNFNGSPNTVTLNASGATTYTWGPISGLTTNTLNGSNIVGTSNGFPTGTGTVIGANGTCTNIATFTVNIINNPIISVSSGSMCFGTNVGLTSNGASTYTWSPAVSLNTQFGNNVIANPSITTVYSVIGSSVGCNSQTQTGTVTVVNNPTVTITPSNPVICFGNNINLTANGANNYTWTPNIALSTTLGANVNANPSSTQTYSIIGEAATCTNVAVVTVTVLPLPVVNLTSNSPLCVGKTLSLTANTGSIWSWTGPNLFTSNVQNPVINNVSNINSGVYSVNVTNLSGCTSSASINVIVNPLPTPNIVSNSPICTNQNLTFNGTGGTTFTWTGPGFNSNSPNPVINGAGVGNSGTYTLSVTDVNGCTNSITANATVHPLPIVTAMGSTVCSGVSVTLTSNGGISYSWTGPNGFTSNNQNPTIGNANTNMNGNYVVTVTDVNGCVNANMANVSVIPPFTVNISNNSPICQGGTLSLTTSSGYGYSWTGPNGFVSNLSSPSIINIQPSSSGVYQLTATDANGCKGNAATTVTINPNPIVSIVAGKDRICAPACVAFTVNSTTNIGYLNWYFQNGAVVGTNTTTQCFSKGGIYTSTVNVTDNNGCQGNISHTIEIYSSPVADFVHEPIRAIENEEIHFTDASFGVPITNWYWFFNSQNLNSISQNPSFVYETTGSYPVTLIVSTAKGCTDTITKIVNVGEDYSIYVPDAFTPNGDGINDIFQPKGHGITKYELRIFDRWGEELFFSSDFYKGWDGTYKGKIAKDDVYVWKINLTNVFGKSHELTGHVTLIK